MKRYLTKKTFSALLLAVLLALTICQGAYAAVDSSADKADITQIKKNQAVTINGQYLKIKSYKFVKSYSHTYKRKKSTSTAGAGEIYLIISADWRNVSGRSLTSDMHKKNRILSFEAQYDGLEAYPGMSYPKDYKGYYPPFFELYGEDLQNGGQLDLNIVFTLPKDAKNSGDMRIWVLDADYEKVGEYVIRNEKKAK